MRIAILSDIHGNLAALKAVLNSIEKDKVDQTIFLGDYFGEFSSPNEVFDLIRNHENSLFVSGNKERYFSKAHFKNKKMWAYEHFQVLYWNHEQIKLDHHKFIDQLPVKAEVNLNGKHILYTHDDYDVFRSVVFKAFTSNNFMALKPKSHEDYLKYVAIQLKKSPAFQGEIKKMKADIILFGHSHIQWHAFSHDKLILNPGSVGLPLNYNKGAAYSLIDIHEGEIKVIEKQVPYAQEKTIEHLRNSSLYDQSIFWSELGIKQLERAEDISSFFFKHVAVVKKKYPQSNNWPVDNKVFRHAVKTWSAKDSTHRRAYENKSNFVGLRHGSH